MTDAVSAADLDQRQAVLEQDHAEIEDTLNRLEGALHDDSFDSASANQAFVELIEHLKAHFWREEGLMLEIDYPALGAHSKLHRNLIDAVEEFHAKFQANKTRYEGRLVYDFVAGWLNDHTEHSDKIITDHIARMTH